MASGMSRGLHPSLPLLPSAAKACVTPVDRSRCKGKDRRQSESLLLVSGRRRRRRRGRVGCMRRVTSLTNHYSWNEGQRQRFQFVCQTEKLQPPANRVDEEEGFPARKETGCRFRGLQILSVCHFSPASDSRSHGGREKRGTRISRGWTAMDITVSLHVCMQRT